MPELILLLRLEGPLQSWGIRSRWSRRDTGPEPTKSGIIGLLGCAAGIPRHNWRSPAKPDRILEQWDKVLRFGIRIDRPGTIETDYHTVQGRFWQADGKMKTALSISGAKPDKAEREPPHTEITWRDYLHDASFLVALASDDHVLLRQLAGELEHPDWPGDLKHPKWPLYLGRKSCVPSRPILYRLTDEYENLESAFCHVRPPRDSQSSQFLAWIECPEGKYERQDAMRLNHLRFYDFRRCQPIEVDMESHTWRIIE